MTRISQSLKDGFMIGGTLLLLVMALPIVLLLFLTLRFVLVIGGAVAVASCAVAYAFSPTARASLKTQAAQQHSYSSLQRQHVAA